MKLWTSFYAEHFQFVNSRVDSGSIVRTSSVLCWLIIEDRRSGPRVSPSTEIVGRIDERAAMCHLKKGKR